MSKRTEYIEMMKKQLDELNAKISKLEAKAQDAKYDARAKYKGDMRAVSGKRLKCCNQSCSIFVRWSGIVGA